MLRQALADTGLLDNTVFIFTGDNGYLMGEHGLFDNKRLAYEPSIRIPFLMRYPKMIKPGSTREQLTLNIDVFPTMLELAGVKWPDKVHGRSFVNVMTDAAAPTSSSAARERIALDTASPAAAARWTTDAIPAMAWRCSPCS